VASAQGNDGAIHSNVAPQYGGSVMKLMPFHDDTKAGKVQVNVGLLKMGEQHLPHK